MIIELSKFNSNSAFSNGDWTNTFPPIIVEPNGSLNFKGGFLDYSTSSQQVIELPEDTIISMTAGFHYRVPYIADFNASGSYIVGDQNNLRTFDLYVARDPNNNFELITSNITFTIPAGNYSPDEITEIINYNCVRVPTNLHGCGSDFNNNAENSFFRSTSQNAYTCKLENIPTSSGDAPFTFPIVATDPSQLRKADGTPAFSVGDHVWVIDLYAGIITHTDGELQTIKNTDATIQTINYDTGVVTLNAGAATFPEGNDELCTNPFLVKIVYPYDKDDTWYTNNVIRFYKQASSRSPWNPNNYISANPNDSKAYLLTSMMGASQFQLEYDYNNNSLFQFSYLHTPFYITSAGEQPQEAVDYFFAGYPFNNAFSYVNSVSGIFFTDLQPRSFFSDILGFDLTKLIVTDDPNTHYLSAPLLEGVNITGNLVSNDALYNKSNAPFQYPPTSDEAPLVNNVQTATTQVTPIVATKTQGITTSSFYLIEIGGLADINMVSDTKLFRTIAALGSKEYSNAGVISIYPDGTSFYTNNSPEPVVISSFRVRILDSISKQPSTNLGGRNSIFLELINPPPQIQRPIPQPKEKNKKQIKDKSSK